MVAPIIAAGVMTVARFIAKKGIQQAVKKYGKKAATEAKKHVKDVTTPTREGVKQTRAGVKGMQNYRRGTRIAGGIGVAAGIGVGADGEPGINVKKKKKDDMKTHIMSFLKRFKFLINLSPLQYKSLNPEDKYITGNNPPKLFVEFFENQKNIENINCFSDDCNGWYK